MAVDYVHLHSGTNELLTLVLHSVGFSWLRVVQSSADSEKKLLQYLQYCGDRMRNCFCDWNDVFSPCSKIIILFTVSWCFRLRLLQSKYDFKGSCLTSSKLSCQTLSVCRLKILIILLVNLIVSSKMLFFWQTVQLINLYLLLNWSQYFQFTHISLVCCHEYMIKQGREVMLNCRKPFFK